MFGRPCQCHRGSTRRRPSSSWGGTESTSVGGPGPTALSHPGQPSTGLRRSPAPWPGSHVGTGTTLGVRPGAQELSGAGEDRREGGTAGWKAGGGGKAGERGKFNHISVCCNPKPQPAFFTEPLSAEGSPGAGEVPVCVFQGVLLPLLWAQLQHAAAQGDQTLLPALARLDLPTLKQQDGGLASPPCPPVLPTQTNTLACLVFNQQE